ncbi:MULTISPECIES: hypothetical protein [unclassified Streptomyces]|uniref:hypothetical protein n=1 Tax=unclassified Streptomyces TaxID=2593676 RepID=UPI001CD29C89|nr:MULTISPECIES: hypothetical protein [unclassified Streptomyces]
MTREERQRRIRELVDAAPPLSPEDADRLRALLPLGARAARPPAVLSRPTERKAA